MEETIDKTTSVNEFTTTKYDKLRSMLPETKLFNFKCETCDSKNIDINPIGIPFRPEDIDNESLAEVNRKYMIYLNNLPTKKKAIKNATKEQLLVECKDCNSCFTIKDTIDKNELWRWVNKHHGEENVFLGSKV